MVLTVTVQVAEQWLLSSWLGVKSLQSLPLWGLTQHCFRRAMHGET